MRELIGAALGLFAVYSAIGAVLSIPIVFVWAKRFDPAANAESTFGFRLLALPGSALLWPMLIFKVVRARPRSSESSRVRVKGSQRVQLFAWLIVGPIAMALLAWGVLS